MLSSPTLLREQDTVVARAPTQPVTLWHGLVTQAKQEQVKPQPANNKLFQLYNVFVYGLGLSLSHRPSLFGSHSSLSLPASHTRLHNV
eukprot:2062130-Pleurochrysis_carterae.AAC.1